MTKHKCSKIYSQKQFQKTPPEQFIKTIKNDIWKTLDTLSTKGMWSSPYNNGCSVVTGENSRISARLVHVGTAMTLLDGNRMEVSFITWTEKTTESGSQNTTGKENKRAAQIRKRNTMWKQDLLDHERRILWPHLLSYITRTTVRRKWKLTIVLITRLLYVMQIFIVKFSIILITEFGLSKSYRILLSPS